MTVFVYDRTFEGLLTAVFDAYSRQSFPDVLLGGDQPLPLFHDEVHAVATDPAKSERVWQALKKKLSPDARSMLVRCWLSEQEDAPMLLFRYIRKAVDARQPMETNFADPDVLAVSKLAKKVGDERYRLLQFVRFQKTSEGVYFGMTEPLYNVLPLAVEHFRDRFADQRWLIYDGRRRYGYYYDGTKVDEVTFSDPRQPQLQTGRVDENLLDDDETLFQRLWKAYFNSICIRERLNPVKQKKDMPVRYWKYLTEKY